MNLIKIGHSRLINKFQFKVGAEKADQCGFPYLKPAIKKQVESLRDKVMLLQDFIDQNPNLADSTFWVNFEDGHVELVGNTDIDYWEDPEKILSMGALLVCRLIPIDECFRCESRRILKVMANCHDDFIAHINNNGTEIFYEGNPIQNIGLGESFGLIRLKYCLDCGQIQDKFPAPILPKYEFKLAEKEENI